MTSRRRVLSILAGAVALPVLGGPASAFGRWRGIALGADARIVLDHPDANTLIAKSVTEIRRLEAIFSLYQADSQLSRLNRSGVLTEPAFELIELLSVCSRLYARTKGAFDPTIQTLWSLYAKSFAAGGKRPEQDQIFRALDATGWDHVRFSPREIKFANPDVAMTLNGIAQGFIADKVTQLLRASGVKNVLVNTGEIAAIGHNPEGEDWQVRLGHSKGAEVGLRNAAIATSAPHGTTFDASGVFGHILDPRSGQPGRVWPQISVQSASATEADGLSTAFCLLNKAEIETAKGAAKVFFG